MKHMKSTITLVLLCLFALNACDSESEGILEIEATGALNGLVYIDRDANGVLEIFDAPAEGVTVSLLKPGSPTVIANATTNEGGIFVFSNIPVGRYSVQVLPETLGDSLQFASVDSAVLTVPANDTATAVIAIGYHQIPISSLADVDEGRRVLVQAIAMHPWTTFGDSTLHVVDSTGVMRALLVNPVTIQTGDTVRLLGTVTPTPYGNTILGVTVFRLGSGPLTRQPVPLTTAVAATADDDALAFDLVRIDSAMVVNTQLLPGGEVHAQVDDGSGVLTVVLDPSAQFGSQPNLVAGALLDAVGLLVPTDAGPWILKPRNGQDINARFQRVTIEEARELPAGRLVTIEGLALNSFAAFGDASVHIVDGTGSLRAVNVANSPLVQGDSIRFVGRIELREAEQPVLTAVSPTVLAQNRTLPPPTVLTSGEAAVADGGAFDAALVRVEDAEIVDAGQIGGVFIVGIDDGSGRLELRTPVSIGQAQFVVGRTISVTGLLVPTTGGVTWQLRPRSQADVTITP